MIKFWLNIILLIQNTLTNFTIAAKELMGLYIVLMEDVDVLLIMIAKMQMETIGMILLAILK